MTNLQLRNDLLALTETVAKLQAKVDLDGEEIDALQAAAKIKSRWWKEPSLIVSILAVVLAGVATWLTQAESAEESADQKRQQLSSNIQRINSLERESNEVAQRSPELAALVSGNFTADYALLAVQSAELVAEIPDRVSPSEYLVLCRALYNTGNVKGARGMCEEALRRTNNINDAVAGMRQMGHITALAGEQAASDDWYHKALAVHDDAGRYGVTLIDPQKRFMDHYTELFWSAIDAQRNDCVGRKDHLARARADLEAIPNSSANTIAVLTLENAEKAALAACP